MKASGFRDQAEIKVLSYPSVKGTLYSFLQGHVSLSGVFLTPGLCLFCIVRRRCYES